MSTTDEHTPTGQETTIYDALTAGDQDAIAKLRDDAYAADQSPPSTKAARTKAGPDWLPPAAQFELDHDHAWGHYQADHEMPEPERVENTAGAVDEHNDVAAAAAAAREAAAD